MVLGGLWGAAFPALAIENRPTIAVIGHHGAQLVLVDSSEARALVMVGDPDDALMERIPAVMTLFRQRIDLLIASQPVLLRHAGWLRERWSLVHAVSLQSTMEPGQPAIPTTIVTEGIAIRLGGEMVLESRIGHRGEWDARRPLYPSPMWTISVTHSGGTVVISPDAESIDVAAPMAASLLISPEMPPPATSARMPVHAFACNYDSKSLEQHGNPGKPLTRIYPQDIARFVLHDKGIDLPPWTHQP